MIPLFRYSILISLLQTIHTFAHMFSEGEFYRSIIVNVTLVASSLGFIAVFLMKVLELCQEQRKKDNSAINETESQVTQTATNYGAIQSKVHH